MRNESAKNKASHLNARPPLVGATIGRPLFSYKIKRGGNYAAQLKLFTYFFLNSFFQKLFFSGFVISITFLYTA